MRTNFWKFWLERNLFTIWVKHLFYLDPLLRLAAWQTNFFEWVELCSMISSTFWLAAGNILTLFRLTGTCMLEPVRTLDDLLLWLFRFRIEVSLFDGYQLLAFSWLRGFLRHNDQLITHITFQFGTLACLCFWVKRLGLLALYRHTLKVIQPVVRGSLL